MRVRDKPRPAPSGASGAEDYTQRGGEPASLAPRKPWKPGLFTFVPEEPLYTGGGVLNGSNTPPQKRQAMVAGDGAIIPLVYGQDKIGGRIIAAVVYNGSLVLAVAWCQGPIESIEDVWVDDKDPDASITFTHYLGTDSQTADATLVAAFAAAGKTYADANLYTAYSVVVVPPGTSGGFPRISALVKGLKVYDPRSTLTEWSDNPALILADFITAPTTTYGMGQSVDWDSVEDAADACDELIGSPAEKHRILNLALITPQETAKWLDTLRAYAAVWLVGEGDPYYFVVDAPGSSVYSADETNILADSMRLTKRGVLNQPTVMTVSYTDVSAVPYRAGTARVYAAGVLAGSTPWRESRISMPGVNRYSQANREAIERMNVLVLNDLTAKFSLFDEGLKLQVGDIIDVTHPLGLAAKLMRVSGVQDRGFGRFDVVAVEYDPAVYSSAVATGPTVDDTGLPNPTEVPTPTDLVLAEDVYYISSGFYASRIRASWTASTWPFLAGYRVEVFSGGVLVQTDIARNNAYTTPPVAEGQEFTINVYCLSKLSQVGDPAQASLTVTGKNTAPSDVASFHAQAIAQLTLLSWEHATDLDLTAHEIRYWPDGGSWSTSTLLDRVAMPATRYSTRVIAPGTWTLGIKGLDSVRNDTYPNGQPSANALEATITVQTDPNNLLLGDHTYTTPTLTNMAARTAAGITYWVTDHGDLWSALFTGTMSTYTSPVASYHTSGTASLVTESYDMGASVSGTWIAAMDYTALAGSPTFYLELSTDDTNWVQFPGGSANATARYARLRIETTGTAAVRVDSLGALTVSAITRSEVQQSITSAASGPTIVTLAEAFTKYKQVVISPVNVTSSRAWVVDKVETSGGRGLGTGKVLRFDGSTGYVSAAHIAAYASSTFTVEAWVKAATDTTKPCRLVAKGDTADATSTYWELRLTALGKLMFGYANGASSAVAVTSQTGYNDGQWHHVAGVMTGGATLDFYVDGVFVQSSAYGGSYVQPAGDVGIGALPPTVTAGSWASFAKAYIDEVRIWSAARSASEIADNMFESLAGTETNLIALWKLDSASGTTATDSTANANHGTVNGSAWWRPYDGFDFYVFNSSGTQVAQECDVRFEGV